MKQLQKLAAGFEPATPRPPEGRARGYRCSERVCRVCAPCLTCGLFSRVYAVCPLWGRMRTLHSASR